MFRQLLWALAPFAVLFFGVQVDARDIRVYPVAADPSGTCVAVVISACDLVRAAAY